jgi:DNA-binding CsgD family transcriptional regulator
VVHRVAELRAVAEFLKSAQVHPAVLVIEGEAGIGKTTMWWEAVEQARERGFRVLTARADQAQCGFAYSALADLLDGIEPEILDTLPHVQRVAFDRVRLQKDDGHTIRPATDERVVAAAFLTLADRLCAHSPVLVALDDVQWLDPASRSVVAFGVRRLRGRIGVMVADRMDPKAGYSAAWLQLNGLDGVERVRIQPLSETGLRSVLREHLGRALPRTALTRITELSGGNPFYALELAHAMDEQPVTADFGLPGSLADLVRSRLDRISGAGQDVLLAAASVGAPTVDFLAEATSRGTDDVVELLEEAENDGIVVIEGNRVQFTHPLLARGVHGMASIDRRREMHRRLADLVELPELRARHLALASAHADAATLEALDDAAENARSRGAPSAAAELLDLAISLGGDTPTRRIRGAENHFRAGDSEQAYQLLGPVIEALPTGPLRAEAANLLAAIHTVDDRFVEATALLDGALIDGAEDPALVVHSLLLLSYAHFQEGDFTGSQHRVREAVDIVNTLKAPGLTSQVLAMSVMSEFMAGNGFSEDSMRRALELEDRDTDVPVQFQASAVNAIVLGWMGRLDEAHAGAAEVRQLSSERGAESDMTAAAGHAAFIAVWRGEFESADQLADEAVERAILAGGQHIRMTALVIRAVVSSHQGRMDRARAEANEAIDIALRCGSPQFAVWPTAVLGFIEVSLGRYAEALSFLEPFIGVFDQLPGSEITTMWYVPDAVEAMIGSGRSHEVEPLIARLEDEGNRLDRAWLIATGARCRAMWLAAQNDLPGAVRAINRAMTEHDRLPMPFERARTLLVRGQLLRRRRLISAAAQTFSEALQAFEQMGASAWADRARAELTRTPLGGGATGLTAAERRVAELATSGMTNRDVAQALSVSHKTVEANLTQIYRKLGIRSRAQLAQRLRSPGW